MLIFQLTDSEGKHMQVRFLLVHFENLNHLSFHPILTYNNPLSMEKHISAMLRPGMWGTHIEILAAATYYNVALYYSCYNADKALRKGIIGSDASLHFNRGVVVITLTFLEVH